MEEKTLVIAPSTDQSGHTIYWFDDKPFVLQSVDVVSGNSRPARITATFVEVQKVPDGPA
jgi:hypothetical protein